jgi:hypothetical protein
MSTRVWLVALILGLVTVFFFAQWQGKAKLQGLLEESSGQLAGILGGNANAINGGWDVRGMFNGRTVEVKLTLAFQLRDDTDHGPFFIPTSDICTPCMAPGVSFDLRYRGVDFRNIIRDAGRRALFSTISTADGLFDRSFSLRGTPVERVLGIFDDVSRSQLLAMERGFQSHAWRLRLNRGRLCIREKFSRHDQTISGTELVQELSERVRIISRLAANAEHPAGSEARQFHRVQPYDVRFR